MASLQSIANDFRATVNGVIASVSEMHNALPGMYDEVQAQIETLVVENMRDNVDVFDSRTELNYEYRVAAQTLSRCISELSRLLTRNLQRYQSLKKATDDCLALKRDATGAFLEFAQVRRKLLRDIADLRKSLERRVQFIVPADYSNVQLVKLDQTPVQIAKFDSDEPANVNLVTPVKAEPLQVGEDYIQILQNINDHLYDLSKRVQDLTYAASESRAVSQKAGFEPSSDYAEMRLQLQSNSESLARVVRMVESQKPDTEKVTAVVSGVLQSTLEVYLIDYMEPLMKRVTSRIEDTFRRVLESHNITDELDRRYAFLVKQNSEIADMLGRFNIDRLRDTLAEALSGYESLFGRALADLGRVSPTLIETLTELQRITGADRFDSGMVVSRLHEISEALARLREAVDGDRAENNPLLTRIEEISSLLARTESQLVYQQYGLGEITTDPDVNTLDWSL